MESLAKFEGMFENGVSWKDCCNCAGKTFIRYPLYTTYIMKHTHTHVHIHVHTNTTGFILIKCNMS